MTQRITFRNSCGWFTLVVTDHLHRLGAMVMKILIKIVSFEAGFRLAVLCNRDLFHCFMCSRKRFNGL